MTANGNGKALTGRDPTTGRFLVGNPGGGRPIGSKNKLAEAFITDVLEVWEAKGIDCLYKMSEQDPAGLCRLVGNVLPKELDVTVAADENLVKEIRDFTEAYRLAKARIGVDDDEDDAPMIDVTPQRTETDK